MSSKILFLITMTMAIVAIEVSFMQMGWNFEVRSLFVSASSVDELTGTEGRWRRPPGRLCQAQMFNYFARIIGWGQGRRQRPLPPPPSKCSQPVRKRKQSGRKTNFLVFKQNKTNDKIEIPSIQAPTNDRPVFKNGTKYFKALGWRWVISNWLSKQWHKTSNM